MCTFLCCSQLLAQIAPYTQPGGVEGESLASERRMSTLCIHQSQNSCTHLHSSVSVQNYSAHSMLSGAPWCTMMLCKNDKHMCIIHIPLKERAIHVIKVWANNEKAMCAQALKSLPTKDP